MFQLAETFLLGFVQVVDHHRDEQVDDHEGAEDDEAQEISPSQRVLSLDFLQGGEAQQQALDADAVGELDGHFGVG